MKRKYTLEFDAEPSLVFVYHNHDRGYELYQDGKKVRGINSLTINAGYGEVPTHEVKFVTGSTKEETI